MKEKRVLFIGIGFYDYDQAIIKEFENLGYKVDYFSEVPTSSWYKLFLRLKYKKGIDKVINKLNNSITKQANENYDIIFVIKGEILSVESIKKIKQKSLGAQCILYLWDSLNRIPLEDLKLKLFDKIYTFDRADVINNTNMYFNPLFFRKEFITDKHEINFKYDLFFLGWYHSDRFILIKKLADFCSSNNLSYVLLLYTSFINYMFNYLNKGELKGNKSFLIFKPLSVKQNAYFIKNAKVVLDIAHPQQSGLTMRTIELLGAEKKIITTNRDIVNYDFYNENNILVIDRENPILNIAFFEIPYEKISDSVVEYYRIDNWLKRML